MAARFLLRFDDICPGMNWPVWRQVERILSGAGVEPLLAVVPDNRDARLDVEPNADNFWSQVRGWQGQGWAIGLHGFQHLYLTRSAGILGRNRYSEFAGLPEAEQRRKLQGGLDIFRAQGVRADAWVAPAHSFDQTTVSLLSELGIDCISDGYGLAPWVGPHGMLWVPQQIGRFYPLPTGLWTVCLHINGWNNRQIERFEADVTRYRARITSLPEMRREFGGRPRQWSDMCFERSFRALRALKRV